MFCELGLRNAYHEFCKQQRNGRTEGDNFDVSYYSFLSNFTMKSVERMSKKVIKNALKDADIPKFKLALNSTRIDRSGLQKNVEKHGFVIEKVYYKFYKLHKEPVIVYGPHFSIDYDNERCCASMVLMHFPWPQNGELFVLNHNIGNGKKYESYIEAMGCKEFENLFPSYFKAHIAKQKHSDECFDDVSYTNIGRSEFDTELNVDGMPEDDNDNDYCNYDDIQNDVDSESNDELRLTLNTVNGLDGIKQGILGNQLKDFIANKLRDRMSELEKQNEISYDINSSQSNNNNSSYVPICNYENVEQLKKNIATGIKTFNVRQRQAVEHIEKYFKKDPNDDHLIMFLSGEGGTGKTTVIKLLCDKAKVAYGKLGGPHDPMLCMAPTGSAANTIDGFTYANIFHVQNLNLSNRTISSEDANKIGFRLKGMI